MSAARKASTDVAALPWRGPERRYDIVKEFVIALVVMAVLSVGLAVAFSSPDEKALTFKGWGTTAPENFYATAVGELAGTTESAAYGPPYQEGDGLAVGPLRPQKWMGVRIPVDAANDFVITPLKSQEQPAEVTSAIAPRGRPPTTTQCRRRRTPTAPSTRTRPPPATTAPCQCSRRP